MFSNFTSLEPTAVGHGSCIRDPPRPESTSLYLNRRFSRSLTYFEDFLKGCTYFADFLEVCTYFADFLEVGAYFADFLVPKHYGYRTSGQNTSTSQNSTGKKRSMRERPALFPLFSKNDLQTFECTNLFAYLVLPVLVRKTQFYIAKKVKQIIMVRFRSHVSAEQSQLGRSKGFL